MPRAQRELYACHSAFMTILQGLAGTNIARTQSNALIDARRRHVTLHKHTLMLQMKLTSISLSCLAFSAPARTKRAFSSSSSGRSCATTMPSSWSSSPSRVMPKFNRVTCRSAVTLTLKTRQCGSDCHFSWHCQSGSQPSCVGRAQAWGVDTGAKLTTSKL